MNDDLPFGDDARLYATGEHEGIRWAVYYRDAPGFEGFNGYAQLPAGHPWLAIGDYDNLPVQVHGGLTYGPKPKRVTMDFTDEEIAQWEAEGGTPFPRQLLRQHHEAVDTDGWIGFDTAHAGDLWEHQELASLGREPNFKFRHLLPPPPKEDPWTTVWTMQRLEQEVRSLCSQISSSRESPSSTTASTEDTPP